MANSYKETTVLMMDSKTDATLVEHLKAGTQQLLKYTSLVTLTVQNAALNLTMRMARTQKDLFMASTAVVMAEVIKLITCLALVWIDEGSFSKAIVSIYRTVIKQPMDTVKVAIPSLVYTLQNNLIYVGATHLDAATCQVTYQLKILTTALFSVAMLHKRLSPVQWIALLFLFLGVALVQLAQISAPQINSAGRIQYPFVGFTAIFIACCLSGFAGVYFEKILKGSDISVWMRNVQLSTLAIPFGLITLLVSDFSNLQEKGFFFGYNALIWIVILLQALGGLIVAVVVKYADNILKGFATSLAIVLSCIVSVYAFNFQLTLKFVVGAALVIASIFLYSQSTVKSNQDFKK
ncbi:UDP-N-acetylglucosamine transporter-like isoform X1 [Centruroides sculpturatus]|uniref:UDP-N-acetylglucosamine transporter-like isoform X1 n=2 Tax=Centruroides sculpturatus TaxID=218467 RepID=UPI000C6E7BE9|nr:UDP-N-acetylglucosamine transporter-like isoform X1 [Centruroides sculpturatus]XP_023219473.1 UDP-N-acetylglucosamine transporter-like isoform X1 [Centruroides sculpturatus]XP_023219474.1 UDP-N-acetylglucosamine transporter-like isoform X1 [Centruroides sculpturatus]XP_023219475.1 UDP-N-acetylglucosamine transporter-like isoform X1 [Centruroides sculpturatus]XP_023219476.1 UDP-N-acetylglucosamine transporter-like isoform X1 [Centruroides sculpturatus]